MRRIRNWRPRPRPFLKPVQSTTPLIHIQMDSINFSNELDSITGHRCIYPRPVSFHEVRNTNADQCAALVSDDLGMGKLIGMMLYSLHSCRRAKAAKGPYCPTFLIAEPHLIDSFINDWINYFSESGLVIRKFHGYKAERANDVSRKYWISTM